VGAGARDESPRAILDFAASFEAAVVDQLLAPLPRLISEYRPDLITVSGGVAANSLLRRSLGEIARDNRVEALLPARALTTDNAAMIAHAGQVAFEAGQTHDPRRLDARARSAWQPPGMRRQKIESTNARRPPGPG
jgi:N6-L-threonylcarbamoyladenine synthase